MGSARHRNTVCPHIAYMPQGLGRNLYPTLSVAENLRFFARLFGHDAAEQRRRIDELTRSTGLHPFLDRPVGKLSGGMKQKLGLCCALIHDPELLILDEPTTGVDPLSRSQFWELIERIRAARPAMSVIVATAYMDEAERFDWLVAMDAGRVLATGTPHELRAAHGHREPGSRVHRVAARREAARASRAGDSAARDHRGCGHRDRGRSPDHALRRFRRGRPRGLSHPPRRDLRLPRLQRLRQDHHDEDADRAAAGLRRARVAVRQGDRSARHRHAPARRLHVAVVLALRRAQRGAEPGAARAPVRGAGGRDRRRGSGRCCGASASTRCVAACPSGCRWACASACRWQWRWCTSPNC